MDLRVFYSSAQGASHIRKNKECQDYSGSYCDDTCAIAIVCDGHGGDDYVRSGIGSKIACEVAKKNIITFIKDTKAEVLNENADERLMRLEASIISGWGRSVRQHFDDHPFTDEELKDVSSKARKKYEEGEIEGAYGTTLIAVAMTEDYWFGLQIGDGKCVAVTRESQFGKPIPRNDKCFLNATTSICDIDALANFRHRYSQKLPAAIFVGSDGTDDSFSNDEQLYGLYRTIVYSFGTTDFDEAKKDLEDYLPRLSAKGSGDDVSIAAIFDMNAVAELRIVKDFDPEKEKARIAEAEKREAEKRESERKETEQREAEQRKTEQKETECRETGMQSAAREQADGAVSDSAASIRR
ncbi:MAG: protein phosphatase 2C domain-containing protein [Lachnospiraceae bacterium]|nr:protein phosphatase 2C domain-containing protein [Lachnospiraceae bacterium]